MNEPKRLLDSRGGPSDMTRLLRAAQRDAPPPGLRRSTWQSLAVKSAAAGLAVGASSAVAVHGTALAATATSGASAASGTPALLSKGLLLLALKSAAAGTGIGVCALYTHHAITELAHTDAHPPAKRPIGVAIATRSMAPSHARHEPQHEPQLEPLPALDGTDPLPAFASVETLPLLPIETLGEVARKPTSNANPTAPANANGHGPAPLDAQLEAQRVAQIRRILRAGDGNAALQSLAALDRESTRGVLGQERDALRIDALLLLGQRTQAQRLEQQFAQRYPNSPLLKRWNP